MKRLSLLLVLLVTGASQGQTMYTCGSKHADPKHCMAAKLCVTSSSTHKTYCGATMAAAEAQEMAHEQPECKNGALDRFHFARRHGDWLTNDVPAKCIQGHWVRDEDAWKKLQQEDAIAEAKSKAAAARKVYLWNALRTRVVTDSEMKEILEDGVDIIPSKDGGGPIDWCGSAQSCGLPSDYKQAEDDRARNAEIIFNDALLNQFKMRVMQEKAKP